MYNTTELLRIPSPPQRPPQTPNQVDRRRYLWMAVIAIWFLIFVLIMIFLLGTGAGATTVKKVKKVKDKVKKGKNSSSVCKKCKKNKYPKGGDMDASCPACKGGNKYRQNKNVCQKCPECICDPCDYTDFFNTNWYFTKLIFQVLVIVYIIHILRFIFFAKKGQFIQFQPWPLPPKFGLPEWVNDNIQTNLAPMMYELKKKAQKIPGFNTLTPEDMNEIGTNFSVLPGLYPLIAPSSANNNNNANIMMEEWGHTFPNH